MMSSYSAAEQPVNWRRGPWPKKAGERLSSSGSTSAAPVQTLHVYPPRTSFIPRRWRRSLRGIRSSERSEEHTSELQSQSNLVCRLLLEKQQHRECLTSIQCL